jgi:hypothetical protein
LDLGGAILAGYSSHADYMKPLVEAAENRKQEIEQALRDAFTGFIEPRSVDVILFAGMTVHQLSAAVQSRPLVLKPLLAVCNIAGRAIERDLGIKNVDTYAPTLSEKEASAIAGYLKPFLPEYLELPALSNIDRVYFLDKEIRKGKGQWERRITAALSKYHRTIFVKRKFDVAGEEFEVDSATPAKGDIQIGVDVKRIEARRDIHKRCDEIVNKASKFKRAFEKGKFAAVIYYPFIDEHINIQSRLTLSEIDAIAFASDDDSSIDNAVQHLLATLEAA